MIINFLIIIQEDMKEQEIIIILSRLYLNDQEKKYVIDEVKKGVDWKQIIFWACKNKILPLIWNNIIRLHIESFVPVYMRKMIQYMVMGVKLDNILYLEEFEKIKLLLDREKVFFLPLKGTYLIPNIYKSYSIRTMGDVDCLVSKKNVEKIKKVMEEIGYIQGEIDLIKKEIKPLERFKEIVWNTHMTNMPPFYKLTDKSSLGYIKIDFSVCLDFDRNYELTERLLEDANSNTKQKKIVLFLHVCAHLYKEAVNDTYIKLNKDINLIKFCDIREFILSQNPKSFLSDVIAYANENGVGDALYYSLYYLTHIYGDDYRDLLSKINVSNSNIINCYKKSGTDELVEWKKSITQRLFSDDNEDELSYNPAFFELFEMKHAVTQK